MKEELFNDLIASIKEGGTILRGEKEPYRTFHMDRLDIKRIREGYNLTQKQFAAMLGLSVRTLRNWEQGRRVPKGPAMVLLRVAEKHSEALIDTLHSKIVSKLYISEGNMDNFELSDDLHSKIMRLSNQYYKEAEKCRDSKAYLAGCVMIGAAFEAMLLSFVSCLSDDVSESSATPHKKGKIKPLIDWSLAELLDVVKERNWLPFALTRGDDWIQAEAQIGDYCELIREIRNLIHPARYSQDLTRKRITKRYLDAVFEIFHVTIEYLRMRINASLRKAVDQGKL